MIRELRMEEDRWYAVDSNGNEHEIAPMVDVDADAYMEWTKATPYEPVKIKFPTIDEWISTNIKCEGLRSSGKAFKESMRHWDEIDAMRYYVEEDIERTKCYEKYVLGKKEGENMKILNMYVEKSQENIRKYYDNLIEMERNNDVVAKEYDELINKFVKDMEKLAEKYNESNTPNGSYLTEDCGDYDFHYMVSHKITEKEEMYYKLRDEEMKQLHEKIEEINAQLEMLDMFGDENNANYDVVQDILTEYGVINENGRLTPYTPTFADEEAPKKAGRPKKVSE